jgi:hypothetical protein
MKEINAYAVSWNTFKVWVNDSEGITSFFFWIGYTKFPSQELDDDAAVVVLKRIMVAHSHKRRTQIKSGEIVSSLLLWVSIKLAKFII